MSGMKMLTHRGLWFGLAVMIAALLLSFPNTVRAAEGGLEQVKKDLAEAGQAIKNFTVAQKDEAVLKAEAALKTMDKEIEAMEARVKQNWNKMDRTARKSSDAALKTLKKQRQATAKKLEELKGSSAKSWDRAKDGFVKSYQSLREGFEKAVKEF
jgi:DUF438 domain-containing protein